MVTFKTLKYKHRLQAMELFGKVGENGKIEANTVEETIELQNSFISFIMSLVVDWDYKDTDTGEDIPVGEPDELTDAQINEVIAEFQTYSSSETVKKTSEGKSSSSSRTRKRTSE